LFAETASLNGALSGGFNGRAFVWPASTQFRVFNTLAQIQPAGFVPTLRTFADELQTAYWDDGYRSGAGGGDRFYDDNAHLVVALVEAYRLTNDIVYLNRAKDTQAFVLQGEDSVAGGGIYFQQFDFSSKDAISTLQGARGAAMLYRATGEPTYLNDATRLLTWARTHIQRADGMFSERWNILSNMPEGFDLVNSAGIGISTNLELYDATGSAAYLAEAQRMANRTLTRYFDSSTGRINDEGYWAFELVDALDNLYQHDHNATWLNKINGALVWLHNNKRDPNAHYGLFWGRNGAQVSALSSWNLNEQACVARAYLYTSTVPEPPSLILLGFAAVGRLLHRRVKKAAAHFGEQQLCGES
jgi:glycosyl hydrolase family 76